MSAGSSSSQSELQQLIEVQLSQLVGPNTCSGEEYANLHILGQGAHGTTRVVRRKHDGLLLCRKWISFERLPQAARPSEVLREVEILMMLDGHPHVIGFVGAFAGGGGLNIVQEYAEGGTLQQRLDRRRERDEALTEPEVLDTFVQIVAGLTHMHAHGVLHRDVKPANVFFDRRNLCRLGDFGIASLSRYAHRPRSRHLLSRAASSRTRCSLLPPPPCYRSASTRACMRASLLPHSPPTPPFSHLRAPWPHSPPPSLVHSSSTQRLAATAPTAPQSSWARLFTSRLSSSPAARAITSRTSGLWAWCSMKWCAAAHEESGERRRQEEPAEL